MFSRLRTDTTITDHMHRASPTLTPLAAYSINVPALRSVFGAKWGGGAPLNIKHRRHTPQPALASSGAGDRDEIVNAEGQPRRRRNERNEHPQAVRYEVVWCEWYSLLQQYVDERGELPTQDEKYQGRNLGVWCAHQRRAKRNGELSLDRAQTLEGLRGCDWVWEYNHEEIWCGWYSVLQQFVDEKGRLPTRADEPYQGRNLYKWCVTQRWAKRNGKLRNGHRAERLEAIRGCEWVWDFNLSWEETFTLVQEYVDEHRRLPKTDDEPYQGRNLGEWCVNQRVAKRNGTLLACRAERLEGIHGCKWLWDYTVLSWEESLNLVREFAATWGRPPRTNEIYGLYQWCLTQRHRYQGGRLSAEEINMLTTIDGWTWGIREHNSMEMQRRWDAWYELLLTFVERHGRIPRYKEPLAKQLGSWCSDQRKRYHNGNRTLTAARICRLESVPGWYWKRGDLPITPLPL